MTPADAGDEDAADIRRVLAGDTSAFGGIVRRWQSRLVKVGVLASAGLATSGAALLQQLDATVLQPTWSELSAVGPELGYAAVLAVLSIGLLRAHRIFTACENLASRVANMSCAAGCSTIASRFHATLSVIACHIPRGATEAVWLTK